jgi:hypothetical protein
MRNLASFLNASTNNVNVRIGIGFDQVKENRNAKREFQSQNKLHIN